MERRRAFRFELMPNGEQQRQMSRSAGCARYIYNKGLALKQERYVHQKEKLTRFQLDKMLVEWKQATPWLAEAPAHALQQALLDLERAYTNRFRKRAQPSSAISMNCRLGTESASQFGFLTAARAPRQIQFGMKLLF